MIKYTIATLLLLFIIGFAYFALTDAPVSQNERTVTITINEPAQ